MLVKEEQGSARAKSGPELSVIIPVLNEADHLPGLLAGLKRQRGIALEVIVGDGGSSDGSQELARAAGALWVAAPPGRGAQMNAAAQQARGEFLLFLHGDSILTSDTLLADGVAALRRQLAAGRSDAVAGHFALRFVRTSPGHDLFFHYLEAKSSLNRPNTTNGDQGFLLSRAFFAALGGFSTRLPFLEDQELAERIRRQGSWLTLPGQLATSARRFEREGVRRRYLLMGIMMGCYCVGLDGFFEGAPTLYRAQHQTERLRLGPFFRLLWRLGRRLGLRGNLRFWLGIGRYIRLNAWQPFFYVDVLLGRQRAMPLLRLHDRLVSPLLDFALVDTLVGGLAFIWYMVLLPACFGVAENLPGRRRH